MALTLLLLFVCGCSGREAVEVVTPGYLNSKRDIFDHKEVLIKGVLLYETENTALWDTAGDYPNGSPSHCVTILSSKEYSKDLAALNHKLVVIRGIFMKNFMKANGIFLGSCNVTGVDVISVAPSGG